VSAIIMPVPKPEYNAWPDVPCGKEPIGCWIICQYKMVQQTTKSGLVLKTQQTMEDDQFSMSAARVVAIGAGAFRDQETGKEFYGTPWFKVGDFVRIPLTGMDRYKVDTDWGEVHFAYMKDLHVKAIDTAEAEEYERLWKRD
jgi:co-chaperonin GroES (HSP10)